MAGSIPLGDGRAHVAAGVMDERKRELDARREPSAATNRMRFDDPEALESLLSQVRSLLRDVAEDVEKRDRKARIARSGSTTRHRLGVCIGDVEEAITSLRTRSPFRFDWVRSIVELKLAASLFATWSRDPAWTQMRPALKERTTYAHDISVLATATHFVWTGNDVWLRAAPGVGRAADLRVVADARHYMDVEVKAPKELRDRTTPLSAEEAEHLVNRNLQRAQLDEPAALLVMSGFHLARDDLRTLQLAAQRRFAKTDQRSNVAAIVFLSLGIVTDYRENQRTVSRFRIVLDSSHSANPGYKGIIPFQVNDVGDRDRRFEDE